MSFCNHNGPNKVIDSNGLQIFGASRNEAEDHYYQFDLIISLGEHCKPTKQRNSSFSIIRSVGLQRVVDKYMKTPERLILDWPDFGVPKLSREFWVELVRVLKKKGFDRNRSKNKYKVMIHCMGGP